MLEQWKTLHDFPDYAVSSFGRVRRKTPGNGHGIIPRKILKQHKLPHLDYLYVHLYKNKKPHSRSVHRLVAIAFLGLKPSQYQVDHKDFNGMNNTLTNLRWLSASQNRLHSLCAGRVPHGQGHWNARLTTPQIRFIRSQSIPRRYATYRMLAKRYGVSMFTIRAIVYRQRWKHLS